MATDLNPMLEWLMLQREKGIQYLPRKGQVKGLVHDLDLLKREVEKCTRCPLHRQRKRVVFGEGPKDARIMLVGEAPGREEDLTGRPFVGPSGALLERMLGAMGLRREEVFITSALKCRPPGNRTPRVSEVRACRPYLYEQIRVIRPKVILALGRTACFTLTGRDATLESMRGKALDALGIPVIATYHPSYILRFKGSKREKDIKKEAWEDLKAAMEILKG